MARILLFILGISAILTGLFVFVLPQVFYDMTPGLDLMGPFSIHFIRDVGLAFMASGGAMLWGASKYNRAVAISGASWPFLHALFHVQIWMHRGFPIDQIFAFNLAFVIAVGFAAMWAAVKLKSP